MEAKVPMSWFFLLVALLFLLFVNINGSEEKVKVGVYELKRGNFSVKLTNYGAVVQSVILPDKFGLFLPLSISLWLAWPHHLQITKWIYLYCFILFYQGN